MALPRARCVASWLTAIRTSRLLLSPTIAPACPNSASHVFAVSRIDTRVDWNPAGEQIGSTTDGSRPRLQKTGPYDRIQVKEDNRRYSRQVLREVATTLRMSQYEDVMWGYLERVVGEQWGKGEWVRVWSAAVAHIVARTRRTQVMLSISDIATALDIKLRYLYGEFRTIVGFLRVRHVVESAGVSAEGTKILLDNVNVHNGEIFALKVRELEKLEVPVDDIRKVVSASSKPAAAGERVRFPLPEDGVDPRDLIDRLVKRIVPENWFRDNPVTGNPMVRTLSCFEPMIDFNMHSSTDVACSCASSVLCNLVLGLLLQGREATKRLLLASDFGDQGVASHGQKTRTACCCSGDSVSRKRGSQSAGPKARTWCVCV